MERASVEKPQLAQLADRIASPFLLGVLIASAAAAAWWWSAGPAHALSVAVAVLIVTCPCALSLATPAATLAAAGGLARRGVLVRRLQALEACAGIDTVVFDKTGTLTRSQVSVVNSHCRPGTDAAEALGLAAALAPALAASRFAGHRGRGRGLGLERVSRARRPRAVACQARCRAKAGGSRAS